MQSNQKAQPHLSQTSDQPPTNQGNQWHQQIRLQVAELVLNAKIDLPSRNPNDLLAYCGNLAEFVIGGETSTYAAERPRYGATPTGSKQVGPNAVNQALKGNGYDDK